MDSLKLLIKRENAMEETNPVAIETRRRSRSKTPLTLRSSVDRDLDADPNRKKSPIKKNPTVETIVEESPVPAPAPVKQKRGKRNQVVAVEEISSENGKNSKEVASSVEVAKSVTTVTVTTTKVTKSGSEQNGNKHVEPIEQKSQEIEKTTRSTRSTKEVNQNDSNAALFEAHLKLQTSTPRASSNNASPTNRSPTASDLNLEEHIPFKEYRDAGEYWNKYPKTDYTYSKLSPHRRELAPGVVALPNMSRRSLDKYNERVNLMAQRNPDREAFLRARFQYRRAADTYYDSGDEADLSFSQSATSTFSIRLLLRRWIVYLTTLFAAVWTRIRSVFRRTDRAYYRTSNEPGVLRRAGQRVRNGCSAAFTYVYLGISSVLLCDCILLQSARNVGRKRFLTALAVLLPILLLGGAYVYFDQPDITPYVTDAWSQISNSSSEAFETSKTWTVEKYANTIDFSTEYLDYLKSLVDHSVGEAQKLWAENF